MDNRHIQSGRTQVVLCVVYLVGSSIKNVRQEVELSDRADMGRHLNLSDQLIVLQRPQMKQVGTTASDEALPIPANTSQALLSWYHDIVILKNNIVALMRDALCDSEGFVGDFGSRIRHRKLMFAHETVGIPREDGVISETTQHDVTERQEKHLQQEQSSYNGIKLLFEEFQIPELNIHLLDTDRLPGCELPYSQKGVQVPEVRCVQGSADGILT